MTSDGQGPFEVTGGSVLGRDHLLAGRNNQDAFAWRQEGSALAAVVCDGCGSAPRSEVGAAMFARLLPALMLRALSMGVPPGRALLDDVQREALSRMGRIAEALGGDVRESVHEQLLFTVVGAVLSEQGGFVFSLGDGLILWNGEPISLGPFEGNAPPYLAYGLLGREVSFTLHRTAALADVDTVVLGTDGATALLDVIGLTLPGKPEPARGLAELVSDDAIFRNRDALRRRLALMNREAHVVVDGRLRREPGLLADDTTLIAIRRRKEA